MKSAPLPNNQAIPSVRARASRKGVDASGRRWTQALPHRQMRKPIDELCGSVRLSRDSQRRCREGSAHLLVCPARPQGR